MTRYATAARRLGLLSLLLLLALTGYAVNTSISGVTAAPVAQANQTVVSVQPSTQTIGTGDTAIVEIQVSNVSDLFGADLSIRFDPAVLQVVDANPLVPGVQVEPGAFLDISGGKGFVVKNEADNTTGVISYAATLLSPASPVSGTGPIARIAFQGVAPGTGSIKLESVQLSDSSANPIQADTKDGAVTVVTVSPTTPPTVPPGGNVLITGVVQDCTTGAGVGGAVVRIVEAPSFATVTASDGSYTLGATLALPAEYTIEVTHPNYFSPKTKTTGVIQQPGKDRAHVTVNFTGVDCLSPKPTPSPTPTATPTITPTPTPRKPQVLLKIDGAATFCDGSEVRGNATVEIVTATGGVIASQPVSFRGEYFFYEDFQGLEGIYRIRIRLSDGSVQYLRDATGSLDFELVDIDQDGDIDADDLAQKENMTQINFVGVNCVGRKLERPAPPPPPAPPVKQCIYVVKPSDTLFSIARLFGTTVEAIAMANGISNPDQIFVGQKLVIPNCKPVPYVPPKKPKCFPYTVQRGDTLYRIARKFGTSVYALAQANQIVNPWYIRAGQVIIVCPGYGYKVPPPYYGYGKLYKPPYKVARRYVVKPGDTLYSIALRYRTTPYAIAYANHLANMSFIYPGQVLVIP